MDLDEASELVHTEYITNAGERAISCGLDFDDFNARILHLTTKQENITCPFCLEAAIEMEN